MFYNIFQSNDIMCKAYVKKNLNIIFIKHISNIDKEELAAKLCICPWKWKSHFVSSWYKYLKLISIF